VTVTLEDEKVCCVDGPIIALLVYNGLLVIQNVIKMCVAVVYLKNFDSLTSTRNSNHTCFRSGHN
jgi:hypothetical protein